MSADKLWKVAYRFQLQEDFPVSSVRYAQVGIQRRNCFTGYVHDYKGGGGWVRTWFLDGQEFKSDYEYKDVSRAARREIEKKYPGLCAEIDEVLKQYIYWRERTPHARPYTRKIYENIPAGYMMGEGTLTPFGIGNTYFDVQSVPGESLMVLEDGRVCTLAEFEEISAAEQEFANCELSDYN